MKIIIKHKKRVVLFLLLSIIFGCNLVIYNHAYQFTHYANISLKTTHFKSLTWIEVLETLFFGIKNPRPMTQKQPKSPYKIHIIQGRKNIEVWELNAPHAMQTVFIFHGYGGEKSGMIPVANTFLAMGLDVILVDFVGSGGSEGNQVSIGYHEAQDVKTVVDYFTQESDSQSILFGTSMGATAVMRAVAELNVKADALILECPFGSLLQTVKNRFKSQHLPTVIFPELLVFWGGIQCDFWGFAHNPTEYAQKLNVPTLLMHGAKDTKVLMSSIDEIYHHLSAQKTLKIFPNLRHQSYLRAEPEMWKSSVSTFINTLR